MSVLWTTQFPTDLNNEADITMQYVVHTHPSPLGQLPPKLSHFNPAANAWPAGPPASPSPAAPSFAT